MPARKPVRRISDDDAMVRRVSSRAAPRRFRNLGGKRNNLEVQSFHMGQLNALRRFAHPRNSGDEFS
jgi:hypothetical protein